MKLSSFLKPNVKNVVRPFSNGCFLFTMHLYCINTIILTTTILETSIEEYGSKYINLKGSSNFMEKGS